MAILLTGGTGLVGSAVLRALVARGDAVTALVRSNASAEAVAGAGARALRGDLTDVPWLTEQLRAGDGAIHTASPGDASSAGVDRAVATAAAAAFAGTGSSYVHTSGVWVYGEGEVDETTPFAPPALTAWRRAVEEVALATPGARVTVVAPAIVYGHGQGIPALAVAGAPRAADGSLSLVGDGSQHWTTVHTDDLADLYLRAFDAGTPGAYYIGANGQNPTVRELTEAAARAAGAPGVRAQTVEATRARLGAPFADALMLDQRTSGRRARTELGWAPSRASLLSELESGSYAAAA